MSKLVRTETLPPLKGDFLTEEDLNWTEKIAETYGYKTGSLAIVLMDDESLLRYNRDFLAHDYYTDIITFDYSRGRILSGDLLISVDRVKDNADSNSFDKELRRIIAHGLLHLMGFVDKSAEDQRIMRREEDKCLNLHTFFKRKQ